MNNGVYAAIAMAFYEMQGAMMHDEESGVITIKRRETPWATPRILLY